jgi:Protein of unknown function (DUF2844)
MIQWSAKRVMLLLIILGQGYSALAALGRPESSIEEDRKMLSATERSHVVHPRFITRELSTSSVRVREFVSKSNGVVFGMSWQGRHSPPLDGLLGPYREEYRQAIQKRDESNRKVRIRSRNLQIRTKNLLIERGGQLGDLFGRVLVTHLIPNEVDTHELQ